MTYESFCSVGKGVLKHIIYGREVLEEILVIKFPDKLKGTVLCRRIAATGNEQFFLADEITGETHGCLGFQAKVVSFRKAEDLHDGDWE